MASTDPKWVKLQNRTKRVLSDIDGPAKITPGSGNVKGNGDVISKHFVVECKQRTKKNIIIDQDQWTKICEEAELLDKIPAIVCENESGETMIAMKLDNFEEYIDLI